ncbi:MAG: transporter ATP-binding protein [Ilumatobacteraceae bacterium]|nr:transporter ATP-binding protein [Ilumatobacteraceae bacterium]
MSSDMSPHGICFDAVSKSFGAVQAVRSLDLAIAPGETVALLGPNGAGKSTTLDMLLGLSRPDSGSISLFGASPEAAIADGHVAAMLQTGSLIQNLTVREFVTLVASLYPRPRPVDETLEVAGLTELAKRRTQMLSGGESQRVRFAAAIVTNAELLVLDEPTVALDVESRHSFWNTVRNIASMGNTVIFATHYLDEADTNADRIVLMARGQIVADGSATEIKSRVGGRSIRATLPDVDTEALRMMDGVITVERRGESIALTCRDSDQVLRRLLDRYDSIRDIEVAGAGIEEAFLELTADKRDQEVSR